ncbi:MAG: hypothetical protein CMI27_01980 [Opitutae bacterium]|nr:hypothetical protein [Opitutae bacterium]|tara:strand:- start:42 stop:2114 length:2073 start_codon:yes stop_codon:yes gene_type:complete
MQSSSDPELLYVSKEPDIGYLQETYQRTKSDLGEWIDRRQRDYDTRNCLWSGKSDDFKKHSNLSATGEVFPWESSSDQENQLVHETINTMVAQSLNAIRRAQIVANPIESDDIERSNVISNFIRWLINSRMDEFYDQVELGLNHLYEKGMMVHYCYWESKDLKQQQTIQLAEIAQALPQIAQAIQDGSMDEELSSAIKDQFKVSKAKARGMLKEMRSDGETTIPVTRRVINQPRVKALAPDEDVFWPSYTIDPQEAPYVFHVINMTPEQLRSKINTEGWDEEFVDAAIDLAQQGEADTPINNLRLQEEVIRDDDETIRIIYCYQRLLDEEGTPGIYCTIMTSRVPDLYAKHQLLDYGHGKYPFVVTTYEKTSKRLYHSRSVSELGEGPQNILKIEEDASIDRQSISTLPPLLVPYGRSPSKWGPGVRVPYRTPGEYRFADVPRFDGGSVQVRQYVKEGFDRLIGRNAPGVDPIEAQMKQQRNIDKVFQHLRMVIDQVYTLYQQYGPDAEFFRVTGMNDMQKFMKGTPNERFDFYLQFDAATQDPNQMLERVKTIADLGGLLDKNGTLDTERLLQLAIGQVLPGASEKILLPKETASQNAVNEERQTISELVAGVPPNVKPQDAHELKMQVFQQWLSQPDIQQKAQQDPALQERIQNYMSQRQMQIQQQQNAQIGRLGAMPTQFGQTASAA